MIRKIAVLFVILSLVQCAKEDNVIRKKKLGDITDRTTIEELDRLFAKDSVIKLPKGEELVREYKVIGENGEPSLVFMPRIENAIITFLAFIYFIFIA